MEKEIPRNIKLGLFVLSGIALLIASLYFIGIKQNIFGSTIFIEARFYNANGLMPGNNVRLMGIDVGTVKSVTAINDTMVKVKMIIDQKAAKFIKNNSVAKISTDGLMGNKLINIEPVSEPAQLIKEGDELVSYKAIETSEMLETLYSTNKNVNAISADLREISTKFNSKNSIWNILADTTMRDNLKQTVESIKNTGENTARLSNNLNQITYDIKSGKGTLGILINDTSLSGNLANIVSKLKTASNNLTVTSTDLNDISKKIKTNEGSIGILLNDTNVANNLSNTIKNLNTGSAAFSENMEALKHNFLLKGYFKKQEKK